MANMNELAIKMIREGMDRWYHNAKIDHGVEGGFISAQGVDEGCIRVKWYESGRVYAMDLYYDSCNLHDDDFSLVYLWDENRDSAQEDVTDIAGMAAYANPINRIDEQPFDRKRAKFEALLAMFTREKREAERKEREERESRERAEEEAHRAEAQAEAREKLDIWLAMHRGRPAPSWMC